MDPTGGGVRASAQIPIYRLVMAIFQPQPPDQKLWLQLAHASTNYFLNYNNVREATTICPRPLQVDLLTLKVVS